MNIGLALFLSVGALALFSFLSIIIFSANRTQERSEFHRNETLRKIAEQPGENADRVLQVIREEEKIAARKRREGLKLGALITTLVGLSIGFFLYTVEPEAVALGGIPLMVGVGLGLYVMLLAPKPE